MLDYITMGYITRCWIRLPCSMSCYVTLYCPFTFCLNTWKYLLCTFFLALWSSISFRHLSRLIWLEKVTKINVGVRRSYEYDENWSTVRPRGTRPRGTQTSLGHDFKKGSKILAGHDFGTWTSRDTILKCSKSFVLSYHFSQKYNSKRKYLQ